MLLPLKREIRAIAIGVVLMQACHAIIVTTIVDRELREIKQRQLELESGAGTSGLVLELSDSTADIVASLRALREALDKIHYEKGERHR